MPSDEIYRVIDVNLNRAKEASRVVEDVARFILNNENITIKLKNFRHKLDEIFSFIPYEELIRARNIDGDFLKDKDEDVYKKNKVEEILYSNLMRIQESLRALEEFSKLLNTNLSKHFKECRFNFYEIEKEILSEKL